MPEERPATYRDLIAAEAKKARVPPELAFAIVETESGGRPDAVSPKGARGFFQLMPETAKGLGVDPDDPVQNIRGGLTYLRQQLDAHGGNVEKALQAYNWGPGNVAKGGTPPPETTAYVQRVMSRWQPQTSAQAVRASVVGQPPPLRPLQVGQPAKPYTTAEPSAFGGPTYGQRAAGAAMGLLESFDPRTPEGRRNIAGATGAGIATAGIVGTAPVSIPTALVAGAVGAGAGGMLAETGEQLVGTAPPSGLAVAGAGAEQAAYETAGQAIAWPFRAAGKSIVGQRVKRVVSEKFNTLLEGASAALQGARDYATSAVASARAAKETTVAGAKEAAEQAVTAAKEQAAGLTRGVEERFGRVGAPPPGGAVAAGRQAQAVITGPSQTARDLVGEQVEAAAREGPPVDIRALKAEAQRILAEEIAPPQVAFPRVSPEEIPGAQLVRNLPTALPSQRAAAEAAQAALKAAHEQQVQETLRHPAMQTLGRILNAEDTVPFHEAHLFKRELDDAIGTNWDRSVKTRVTNITKTLRGTLRESLKGFAPYDAATAAYRSIAPLYTKGLAPQLRRVATEDPGAVVRLISPKQPTKLRMLRDLLIEQPAKIGAGARELGENAWNSVRAAWTYDRVIKGSLDSLGDRIAKLDPEFTDVMYGDAAGDTVLKNLQSIATAYQEALATGEANIAKAVAAGKAGVRGARVTGAAGVQQAKQAGLEAKRAALTEKAGISKEAKRFAKSTLIRAKPEEAITDVIRATALGPGTYWGALSLIRILRSPRGADLIEWASRDTRATQLFARAFSGPEMGMAAANLLRLASAPLQGLVPPEVIGEPPPSLPRSTQPLGIQAGVGAPPP